MKKIITTLFVSALVRVGISQGVGIGTTTPDPSAALEISSNNKGVLVPRLTTAQREMIASPATGLLVFDVTTQSFWFRHATSWMELVDSSGIEVHRTSPDEIYLGLTDSVGIGTVNPMHKLQVKTANNRYGISHTNGNVDLVTFVHDNSGGWLGTKSNHPLRLFTNDQDGQFAMLPNGNVGIGVTNPVFKLDLQGDAHVVGSVGVDVYPTNRLDVNYGGPRMSAYHPTGRPLYVTGDLGESSSGIEFRHRNGSQGIGFGYNTIYATGYQESQNLGLSARGPSGYLLFSTRDTTRVSISDKGNVGIGIVYPNAPLHFSNALQNRKVVLYEAANNNYQYYGFGVNPYALRYQVPNVWDDHVFYAGGSDTTTNELLRIRGNGNIGVGVFPTHKLDVHAGAVRTGTHPVGLPIYVTGDIGTESNGMEVRQNNGEQGVGIGSTSVYAAGSQVNQNLGLSAKGEQGYLYFKTSGVERMRISGPNGYVGLGAFDASAPLQFENLYQSKKIVLYENEPYHEDRFYGFGVYTEVLRYQVPTSTSDHVFYSGIFFPGGSQELMRITGDGYLGVGLSNPINRVDVNMGSARSGTHPFWRPLYVTGSLSADADGVEIRHANATQGIGFGYNTIYATGNNLNQDLGFKSRGTTGSLIFRTNETERMRIDGAGKMIVPGDVDVNGKLEIGFQRIVSSLVDVGPGTTGTATCNCPTGFVAMGGGVYFSSSDLKFVSSYPETDSSWKAQAFNPNLFNTYQIQAFVTCARLGN